MDILAVNKSRFFYPTNLIRGFKTPRDSVAGQTITTSSPAKRPRLTSTRPQGITPKKPPTTAGHQNAKHHLPLPRLTLDMIFLYKKNFKLEKKNDRAINRGQ